MSERPKLGPRELIRKRALWAYLSVVTATSMLCGFFSQVNHTNQQNQVPASANCPGGIGVDAHISGVNPTYAVALMEGAHMYGGQETTIGPLTFKRFQESYVVSAETEAGLHQWNDAWAGAPSRMTLAMNGRVFLTLEGKLRNVQLCSDPVTQQFYYIVLPDDAPPLPTQTPVPAFDWNQQQG